MSAPFDQDDHDAGPGLRGRLRTEVDEEIRLHLEARVQDLVEEGWTGDEAWREAIRRFGSVERTRQVCVNADWRWEMRQRRRSWWESFTTELVGGLRGLVRNPGFTLGALGTLALGAGAATVVLGAADHVLVRPLPYEDPERTATVWLADRESGEERIPILPGDFLAWRERARSFERLALAEPWGVDLVRDGAAESVSAWTVSPGFLETIGLHPRLGRSFDEDRPDDEQRAEVIVSDGFWKGRLGGDPDVVGRTLELDGEGHTIVGVLPPAPAWPGSRDLWLPRVGRDGDETQHGRGYMYVAGRLRDGVTMDEARREMAALAPAVFGEAGVMDDLSVRLVALDEQILGDARPALMILVGAVGLLLLVASVNVAGLLVARGQARSGEMGIRAALGADRSRLLAQMLGETVVLAVAGGALALGVAWGGLQGLERILPPDLPRGDQIGMDLRVLAIALAVSVGAALLAGLVPALRFSRPNAMASLGPGSRGTSSGRDRQRLRSGLVVAEIAFAMVLLVGGGLLGRSFLALLDSDLGFEPEGVATVQVFLWDRNPSAMQRIVWYDGIIERIRALPGVRTAGVVTSLPFHPSRIDAAAPVVVDDGPRAGEPAPSFYTTVADSGYFAALGIPVVRGRPFDSGDGPEGDAVALVNESAAARLFPGVDPVGRMVNFGVMGQPLPRRIVGVVGDVRPTTFDSEPQPEVFVPFRQNGNGSVTLVAGGSDARALVAALRTVVWEVDPGQAIYHADTMDGLLAETVVDERFYFVLLLTFALLSLLLAAVGLFGLISYTARQRTRELGIRVALGAERRQVVGLVVRDGLRLALAGVVVGVGLAAAIGRTLTGMLHGIATTDPLTYASLATLMLVVAVVASFLPAWRAGRRDPVRSLREE